MTVRLGYYNSTDNALEVGKKKSIPQPQISLFNIFTENIEVRYDR